MGFVGLQIRKKCNFSLYQKKLYFLHSPLSRYYIDSPLKRVDVFDFDPASGGISNRKELIKFGEGDGYPDGMTIDADGL